LQMTTKEIIKILKNGGIGVMPTDTIYGLVGSAFSKRAVERIYKVRKRERNKPFIVLISSINDLKKFGVKPSKEHLKILKAFWPASSADKPGPISVVLPVCQMSKVKCQKFKYIHRGKNSIAFRLPKDKKLRDFLKKTGPLVAPSANIAGRRPAEDLTQAKKYFGAEIDFYFGKRKLAGKPSSVVAILR
jgi:L-threonylcarbamoyladenylate synthase